MTILDSSFGILVEGTVKGSLLLGAAAVLVLVFRRASAAYRHVIWVCAFVAAVSLPVLLTLPGWRVHAPALAWLQPVAQTSPPTLVTNERFEREVVNKHKAEPANTVSEPGGGEPPSAPSLVTEATPAVPRAPISWTAIATIVWAVGAVVVLAAFLLGYLELRRLLRAATPVEDGAWSALSTEAAERLDLRAPFLLLRGEGLPVPVAVGLLRPRVLLPSGSDAWPLELRRAVLLHELAHVQRHDCLTQAVAQVACALFWFHPGFWWAASQMRAERERACDDCVIRANTKATEYAEHLLGVVRSLRRGGLEAMGTVAFARPSSLEGRLLSVLDPIRDRRAVGIRAGVLAMTAAAVMAVPLAMLEPVQAYTVHVQSKKAAHHEVSDPNALRPSEVVGVPEQSLEDGMRWADHKSAREYWIGWRVDPSPNLKGNLLSDTEGISLWILDQRGFFTVADVLDGTKQGTWNIEKPKEDAARPAAVLVRFRKGSIDRFRVQSLSLPADFGGLPLYWMNEVPDEQTAAWLRDAAMGSGDEDLKRQYVECMGFIKASNLVVPFLTSTLDGSGDDGMRAGAAEALGHHPSPDVVRLLASHARKDHSSDVRRAAVEAMGQLQTPEALEELLKIARATDAVAQRAAYDALGQKVSSRAANAANETALQVKGHLMTWKVEEGDASEGAGGSEPQDEESVEMPDGELDVQRQAIESLGHYPEAQSLPRLREIAESSPNGDLRAQAVESIGRLGTPASIETVESIVWKNKMEDARRSAVEVLGRQLPAEKALDRLTPVASKHPSSDTRRMAIEMIGRMDSPRAVAVLREAIAKNVDTDVQRQAVESLGRREEAGIEAQLFDIARTHESVDVRRQAVESLGRRVGKEVQGKLMQLIQSDQPEDVQRQAVESLGRLDADVMPELAKIARTHPSSAVRNQAVDSMRQRDPEQALRVIEDILRQPRKTGT